MHGACAAHALCGGGFCTGGAGFDGDARFQRFPCRAGHPDGCLEYNQTWALLAVAGIPVAAAFTLRAVQQAFFGKTEGADEANTRDAGGLGNGHHFAPITLPERLGAALLLSVSIAIGIRPDLLLDWIVPALESPLLKIAIQGTAR